jgi:hypothetical protein
MSARPGDPTPRTGRVHPGLPRLPPGPHRREPRPGHELPERAGPPRPQERTHLRPGVRHHTDTTRGLSTPAGREGQWWVYASIGIVFILLFDWSTIYASMGIVFIMMFDWSTIFVYGTRVEAASEAG